MSSSRSSRDYHSPRGGRGGFRGSSRGRGFSSSYRSDRDEFPRDSRSPRRGGSFKRDSYRDSPRDDMRDSRGFKDTRRDRRDFDSYAPRRGSRGGSFRGGSDRGRGGFRGGRRDFGSDRNYPKKSFLDSDSRYGSRDDFRPRDTLSYRDDRKDSFDSDRNSRYDSRPDYRTLSTSADLDFTSSTSYLSSRDRSPIGGYSSYDRDDDFSSRGRNGFRGKSRYEDTRSDRHSYGGRNDLDNGRRSSYDRFPSSSSRGGGGFRGSRRGRDFGAPRGGRRSTTPPPRRIDDGPSYGSSGRYSPPPRRY